MARIRTIKPEFWTSEQVVECSPIARLMFIGMWNFCDDAGNHPASCKTLKMEVFPGDEIKISEIEGYVSELIANSLIVQYSSEDGRKYWHVTGWHHQKIEKPNFKHPPFDPSKTKKFYNHSTTIPQPVDDQSTTEGKGMEGKVNGYIKPSASIEVGRSENQKIAASPTAPPNENQCEILSEIEEENGAGGKNPSNVTSDKTRGTRLPNDFEMPSDWVKWAVDNGKSFSLREIEIESEKFKDYWKSKAGSDARKVDWFATWRNWIRKCNAQAPPKVGIERTGKIPQRENFEEKNYGEIRSL